MTNFAADGFAVVLDKQRAATGIPAPMFYTGRAGSLYLSPEVREAMVYRTEEGAITKGLQLTRMTGADFEVVAIVGHYFVTEENTTDGRRRWRLIDGENATDYGRFLHRSTACSKAAAFLDAEREAA